MGTVAFPEHLVMIGCGNMAGSILARWLESGLDPARVMVVDPGIPLVKAGVTVHAELPEALPAGAVILLGIKPQLLGTVAPKLAPLLSGDKIIVSMLAGVTIDILRDALGHGSDFIRIMPNTPVALGQGVCALYADKQTQERARAQVDALMQPLGLVEWMTDEAQFNLITALTGCGPAFVFRFIDALGAAAAELGLESTQAARLALATVQGAASLASASDRTPAALADAVASPGGMTREGLNVMDEGGRLYSLMLDVLRAAEARGEALARGAK
mgnify:FL=1